MYYLFITILLLVTLITFIYRKKAILFLPLLNLVVDLSFNLFERSMFTDAGVSVPAIFRFLILFIIITFFYRQLSTTKYPAMFWPFFIYSFILCFFSSNIFLSLKNYSQLFLTIMMFPIGFIFFNEEEKLRKFFQFSKYVIAIYVVSFILGNIFSIGTRSFGYSRELDDTVGFISGGGTYAGGVIVALLPLILSLDRTKKEKVITLLLGTLFIIGVVLTARRTAVLIPLIGLITFLIFSKIKIKMLLSIVFAGLVFIIISPIIVDKIVERIEVRSDMGKFDPDFFEREGRYYDWLVAINQATSFDEPLKALFGRDQFADGGILYGSVLKRMTHNDFAVFLKGSGIIGFLLYISLILSLFIFYPIGLKSKNINLNIFKITFLALLFILISVSVNGGYNNISYRSILFLLLGGIARILYEIRIKITNSTAGGISHLSDH